MPLTQVQPGMLGTPQPYNFKNRIINGAMAIDQRNAGASVTNTTGNLFPVDRWKIFGSVNSKFTAQQDAGTVTPPTGFTDYLGCTSSSAYSVLAGDYFALTQFIEGYNIADLGFGTANAQTVTLSFWVRSSLTGTFAGNLSNSAENRSYPFTYTISAANTWQQKSVTIPGDTTGTWLVTNGTGMEINFSLGMGSTYGSGTAGAWTNAWRFPSATSVVSTNGATFYVTGVQLEVGVTATGFDYRPYGTELALCQRYFCKSSSTNVVAVNNAGYTTAGMFSSGVTAGYGNGVFYIQQIKYPVSMRSEATTITFINTNLPNPGTSGQWSVYTSAAGSWVNTGSINIQSTTAEGFGANGSFASGTSYMYYGAWTASAEL